MKKIILIVVLTLLLVIGQVSAFNILGFQFGKTEQKQEKVIERNFEDVVKEVNGMSEIPEKCLAQKKIEIRTEQKSYFFSVDEKGKVTQKDDVEADIMIEISENEIDDLINEGSNLLTKKESWEFARKLGLSKVSPSKVSPRIEKYRFALCVLKNQV